MSALTQTINRFENKDLGRLVAKVQRAMHQGKGGKVIDFHVANVDKFIVANIDHLKVSDIVAADEYGTEVASYDPSAEMAKPSFNPAPDYEKMIMTAWENTYGLEYS